MKIDIPNLELFRAIKLNFHLKTMPKKSHLANKSLIGFSISVMTLFCNQLFADETAKNDHMIWTHCMVGDCKIAIKDLDDSEKQIFDELTAAIKVGTTEAEIANLYPVIPKSKSAPIEAIGQPPKTMAYRVSYYLIKQESLMSPPPLIPTSRVDVYFMNNRAYSFKVWSHVLSHCVTVFLK
jgi:hypothetical protein